LRSRFRPTISQARARLKSLIHQCRKNPQQWLAKYLVPALRKQGWSEEDFNDPVEVQTEADKLVSSSTARETPGMNIPVV